MCEGYMGLNPLVIEQMHIDQILLLICDKRRLKGGPRTITGTPEQLKAMGFLKDLPKLSYVQMIRQKAAEEQKAKESKGRRRRRRAGR